MVNDYRFSVDFDLNRSTIKNMIDIFEKNGCPNTIIEIGSFEGFTTFWLSDFLSQYNADLKIYAIDPHIGSNDLPDVNFEYIYHNFSHNLSVNKNKNVEHIQKFSNTGLIDLINRGVKAELIFVDGDHRAAEVLLDLTLSWQLLNLGGIIVCDDSTYWRYTDPVTNSCAPHMSPRMAVESFIQCHWDRLEPINLPHNNQTAFRKIKE